MKTFRMANKEIESAYEFMKIHKKKCNATSFSFESENIAGIGESTVVICPECRKQKNITDTSCW